MIKSKLNIICLLTLSFSLVLVSCKKKDDNSAGTCTDGFLNNGEVTTDCGGPCGPCKTPLVTSIQATFFSPNVPSASSSFGNGAVSNSTNWLVTAHNDSINMSFNFGTSATVGQHNIINGTNTKVTINGLLYDQVVSTTLSSYVVITENNTTEKYISGNFKLYLRSTVNFDTLMVENGDFTDLVYQ